MAGVRLEALHAAFIDAFSEYDVPMTLGMDALAQMMAIRNYDPAVSIGCFDGAQLVGFILVEVRVRAGARHAYDVATGVIRSHQSKKVGSRMLQALCDQLRAADFVSFQLEVLEQNTAARRLYETHGFVSRRRFVCFQHAAPVSAALPAGWQVSAALPADIDEVHMNGYEPSWQQALASYRNDAASYALVCASAGAGEAAYGIIQRTTGSIMQIAIAPESRAQISVAQVVEALAAQTSAETLRFVNVEDEVWLAHELAALGWIPFVYQHEMIRSFAGADPAGG